MKQILLLREIYSTSFRDLGKKILENSFKVYFWVCMALFVFALFGFIYRVSTGFIFD
ncbi:hypothetical protein GGR42_001696 [Saonia flava]|uniref:Uncharacterized protein n=1 Tax=Saonia flava TaxID=523696 RepID=A0A846R1H5_9FLAO|nr:DUF6747 family protein [Saonia flava]NJB71234.1 hypothetical protein [Saonia flava]